LHEISQRLVVFRNAFVATPIAEFSAITIEQGFKIYLFCQLMKIS